MDISSELPLFQTQLPSSPTLCLNKEYHPPRSPRIRLSMKDKQTEPPKAGEHVGEIGRGAQVPKVQPQVQPYQLASSPVSCTLARRGRGVLGEQGISIVSNPPNPPKHLYVGM